MNMHDVYDAQAKMIKTIRMEIDEQICSRFDNAKAEQLRNFLSKVNIAETIVVLGDENRHLERGAIELLRIQAVLASFFAPQDIVDLFDELSQLSVKCFPEPEDIQFDLSTKDVAMFEALGEFGFENDEYNEQAISEDFLPYINPDTRIGQFAASEVIEWTISRA